LAKLRFFHGLMGSGKSTLLLQSANNFYRAGEGVLMFTGPSRKGRIESRLGASENAITFHEHTDLIAEVGNLQPDRVMVDEAQFLTFSQAAQLYDMTLFDGVNVDCFGLLTDYRGELFEGSKALVEFADELVKLQGEVMCWCGRVGKINARVEDGHVDRSPYSPVVQVGDVGEGYAVLCYHHWINDQAVPQC
jgi:thymidine kinase